MNLSEIFWPAYFARRLPLRSRDGKVNIYAGVFVIASLVGVVVT
jgi:hypothetical protein